MRYFRRCIVECLLVSAIDVDRVFHGCCLSDSIWLLDARLCSDEVVADIAPCGTGYK